MSGNWQRLMIQSNECNVTRNGAMFGQLLEYQTNVRLKNEAVICIASQMHGD
jgi:hypothetical protein